MNAPIQHFPFSTPFARLDAVRPSADKRNYTSRDLTKAEKEEIIRLSTAAQLQFVRQARQQALLSKLDQEFNANEELLTGVNYMLLKARVRLLSDTLLQLNHTYFSVSITSDQSLYGRVHLAAGKGTLHFEILLGEDVDSDEDTFATLYVDREQQWSLAGEFRQTLNNLKKHLG